MRFLIVDDSRAVQSLLRRAILESGLPNLEIELAGDGHAALDIVGRWQPDMVITDWHMPGMSGIELLKTIRARHSSSLKVGFITTESSPESLQEAKNPGAMFILNKPFQQDDLLAHIKSSMEETAQPTGKADAVTVSLTPEDQISTHLASALQNKVQFQVAPAADISGLRLPAHVTLWSLATGAIRGLCILDSPGVITIGGTLLERSHPEIRKIHAVKIAPPELMSRVTPFLAGCLPALYRSSNDQPIQLGKAQVMHQAGPQFHEIIRRSAIRKDFMVQRGDLELGRLILLAK